MKKTKHITYHVKEKTPQWFVLIFDIGSGYEKYCGAHFCLEDALENAKLRNGKHTVKALWWWWSEDLLRMMGNLKHVN